MSRPLGYANAVGILAGVGSVLAFGLVVHWSSPRLRMAAAASVAPFAATFVLTSSRASVLAALVGAGATVALDPEWSRVVVTACLLAPFAVVVAFLATGSKLVDETSPVESLDRAGQVLALWIVLAAAALIFVPWAADRAGRFLEQRARRAALVVVIVALVAAGAVIVLTAPSWWARVSSEGYRPDYWHVAWNEYTSHPWLGSGAGTFGDYWLRYGDVGVAGGALDAHNLYLETLAEVGPVGLALLLTLLAVPLVAAVRLRRRPFVAVAAGGYVTLLAHAALDWDWEMPAVMLAGLVCGAVVVAATREDADRRTLL